VRTSFTEGFASEIEKLGGLGTKALGAAAKSTGGFLAKRPMFSIFGLLPAVTGAGKAFGERVSGAAGTEPSIIGTKAFRPSSAFYQNWHELIPHQLAPWERFKLHRNFPRYRETQRGIP